MTRETKLALIIGFALVMVVGVLISDHIAASSRTPVADLTVGADQADTPAGLDDRPAQTRQPQGASRSHRSPPAGDTRPAMPSQPLVQLAQGTDSAPASQPSGRPSAAQLLDEAIARPGRSTAPSFEPAPGRQPATTPQPSRTPTPAEVWHTVKDGESLWSIAAAYYNNGSRWTEIADANPGRVASGGVVRTGVKLRIPGDKARASQPTPRAPEPDADGTRTYTVKAGDTLGEIAQKLLGTIKRADEIIALNTGTITDADEIRQGMVLRIPPR